MRVKKLIHKAKDEWNQQIDNEERLMALKARAKNVKRIQKAQAKQAKGGR